MYTEAWTFFCLLLIMIIVTLLQRGVWKFCDWLAILYEKKGSVVLLPLFYHPQATLWILKQGWLETFYYFLLFRFSFQNYQPCINTDHNLYSNRPHLNLLPYLFLPRGPSFPCAFCLFRLISVSKSFMCCLILRITCSLAAMLLLPFHCSRDYS